MLPSAPDNVTPTRPSGLEVLPLAGGAAEVVLERTRRLRLSPDALWLLERIDGRRDLDELARELAARFAREVSRADALELIRGSLVAPGLATLPGPGAPPADAPPLVRAHRLVLVRAPQVRRLARRLAPLATGPVAALLVTAALVALGAQAVRVAGAGAAAWSGAGAWVAALAAALGSLLVHELGHAATLARAGGTPGDLALLAGNHRLRLGTELDGLEALTPLQRAGVDVAGVAAQVLFAGALATLALWLPFATAPAIAIVLALALANLAPAAGTDGRWLLDDLARHDPSDRLRRMVSPTRWLGAATARLQARLLLAWGRGPHQELAHLLPVFVSASFPGWSAERLRTHARRHLEMLAVANRDQRALLTGGTTDDIRHVRPLRALLGEGRGAVVCAMHVGPYMYVPDAIMRLGGRVLVYAAANQQKNWGDTWTESARRRGTHLEILSPRSTRDAVRAVRGVRDGAFLVLLMDGQNALSRDQHRADFRFLGNELYLRTGPALLARHAGAPIVLAASWYQGVARRIVEFSDPLPPPADASEAALVERTGQMYAWFERRVAPVSEQWDGWIWPLMHWRATGGSPTATADEVQAASSRAARALAGEPAGVRLVADPTRVNTITLQDEPLIVHGPERRVLVGDDLACRVLAAAFRRVRVRELPARTGADAGALAGVLARLTLAGLATLEG